LKNKGTLVYGKNNGRSKRRQQNEVTKAGPAREIKIIGQGAGLNEGREDYRPSLYKGRSGRERRGVKEKLRQMGRQFIHQRDAACEKRREEKKANSGMQKSKQSQIETFRWSSGDQAKSAKMCKQVLGGNPRLKRST